MIVLKSQEEIELMAKAASVTAAMLEEIPNVLMPGMTTLELDHWCEDYILRHQMKPAFKGYGGFPGTACISVNEEVVHGIPAKRRVLKEGDIVSVDLGTIYKGFYSDAARTYPVGKVSDEAQKKLLKVTDEELRAIYIRARYGDPASITKEDVEKARAAYAILTDYDSVRKSVGYAGQTWEYKGNNE